MYRTVAPYDLVKYEGYFGIVLKVEDAGVSISLGNGTTVLADPKKVEQVSFKTDGDGNAPANFLNVINDIKFVTRTQVQEEMKRAKGAGKEYNPLGPIDF